MSTIYSYDLNGKKLSFANWVSNLSPEETPFCAMTKKEKINQTMFQWQTDYLRPSKLNARLEGHGAAVDELRSTDVHHNYTQILSKVVKVSDTADSIANYGRGAELFYQTEKAGKELKRDLEWAYLHNVDAEIGDNGTARETAGFRGLAAKLDTSDPSSGGVTHSHFVGDDPTEADITNMMYNLYLTGSQANIIMYHPVHAAFFSGLQEKAVIGNRQRFFENTDKIDLYVEEIISPWCQRFKLLPNRFMPKDSIYFFNPKDFTQMILREPVRNKMAKIGSSEKILLEMEAGLKLDNPYAVGVLSRNERQKRSILIEKYINNVLVSTDHPIVKVAVGGVLAVSAVINQLTRVFPDNSKVNLVVYKDDRVIVRHNGLDADGNKVTITIHNSFSASDAGEYKVVAESDSYYDDSFVFTVGVDIDSTIVCTDGDYIESATIQGMDFKTNGVSIEGSVGQDLTDIKIVVKDTAYSGRVSFIKSLADGTIEVKHTADLDSGESIFLTRNLTLEDSGEYALLVRVGNCTQMTGSLILNVTDPASTGPFKAGSLSVDGWLLTDGINTVGIELKDIADTISISFEANPGFVGKDVELVTSIWGKAIHTRKAIAGKDVYSVAVKPMEETQYMLRVTNGTKVYLSPSFSVRVKEDTSQTVVSNLFEPQHTYIGNATLDTDDQAISCHLSQINRPDSAFLAILEYNATGAGSSYSLVDTANSSHMFALKASTHPSSVQKDYTYRYLVPTVDMKLADAGKYVLRAIKNGNTQDSKPFTLAFTQVGNLIP